METGDIDIRFREDLESAVSYLKTVGCTEIYIFGSLSSGHAHSRSDIDIAVRGLQPGEFFTVYGELLMKLNHRVDLVDLDLQKQFGDSLLNSGNLRRVA
jgi:predicted nucleotidyltransferase